ncbi:hypothetical protein HT031_002867 [Scenedesmus sp. PABB004]|nr:hypothetical protein HT031_002867 [Scenedesmus sp. PABB004]
MLRSAATQRAARARGAPTPLPPLLARARRCPRPRTPPPSPPPGGGAAAAAAAAALLVQLAGAAPAIAATVCVEVPDAVLALNPLRSPAVAVGAAALVLLAAPKLIRTATRYLALPAIAALLAWQAVTHPQATASTIYAVLEFVQEHPAASSVGIIAAAGVLLGPDLLAGAAVAGVLLLLAVQAGMVSLPRLAPPALPGAGLVTQQLGRAGSSVLRQMDALDGDGEGARAQPERQQRGEAAAEPQRQPPAAAAARAQEGLRALADRAAAAGGGAAQRLGGAAAELGGAVQRSEAARGLAERARGAAAGAAARVQGLARGGDAQAEAPAEAPGAAGGHAADAANAAAPQRGAASRAAPTGAAGGALLPELAAVPVQPLPAGTPACNGVPGLCDVPVRLVAWPGTHNSNAVAGRAITSSQELGFRAQLAAGARLFDLDAGDGGARLAHCLGCFCASAADPADSDPAAVFGAMAEFLAANPRDVLLIGLSNINCGDKAAARRSILAALAASPLRAHVATQVVGAATTLGELVESGQRAVLLFYDAWASEQGHTVGNQARERRRAPPWRRGPAGRPGGPRPRLYRRRRRRPAPPRPREQTVPDQPLIRIYGADTSVPSALAGAELDAAVAEGLTADLRAQARSALAAASASVPFRVLGWFPSSCLACRHPGLCGPISCAAAANEGGFVLWALGRLTADWLAAARLPTLLPAFNGWQADFFGSAAAGGARGVAAAARALNEAAAWAFTARPREAAALGLANCVWALDDPTRTGILACVHDGRVPLGAALGPAPPLPAAAEAQPEAPGAANASAAAPGNLRRRRLAGALAAESARALDASAQQRGGRWVVLPANPGLTLQLFRRGALVRLVRGGDGRLTTADLGDADALQVLWPPA